MSSGIYSALSAGVVKMQALETETNNLTNASTKGYKKDHLTFESVYNGVTQNQLGRGVNLVKIRKDYVDLSQGESEYTGKPLDLAIEGAGLFKLKDPNGDYHYTRLGDFKRAADGTLITPSGWQVMNDQNRPIVIPSTKGMEIKGSGDIVVAGNQVGKIPLFQVANLSALHKEGGGLFSLDANAQVSLVKTPRIIPNHLEGSNVKPLQEMALMMDGLRAFQAYQKVIKAYGTLLSQANQLGATS